MPATQPDPPSMVRHLLTGTPCPGRDCEECALQSLLTGNVYLTVMAGADASTED